MLNAQTAFDTMASVVNAPGYPLLKNYRQDFDVIDKEVLEETWSRDSQYLWMVRESGNHLVQLGIHESVSSWGSAALSLGGAMDLFTVSPKGVRQINKIEAARALSKADWTIRGDGFEKKGAAMAAIDHCDVRYEDGLHQADVTLRSLAGPSEEWSLSDLVAVRALADLASKRETSAWAVTRSATLDGRELSALIVTRRALEQAHEPPSIPRKALLRSALEL